VRAAAACILDVASLINYRRAVAAEEYQPPGHYHGTDGTVSDELRDRRRQTPAIYLSIFSLLVALSYPVLIARVNVAVVVVVGLSI